MRSILQGDLTVSYLSGKGGPLEKHHIMNGPHRKKAEQLGLWVMITPEEHRHLHDTKDGTKRRLELKAEAQRAYEKDHPRGEWMALFKKNYLEE